MADVVAFCVGDELEFRKPHACGANHWQVLGLGADLRLRCAACGRRLMLPRRKAEQSLKRFLARGPAAARLAEDASGDPGETPDSTDG